MAEVLVGSAYATYELRYAGLTQGASAVEAQLAKLKQQTAQPIQLQVTGANAARGLDQARTAADKALRQFAQLERQTEQQRDSEIALARATGDYTRALELNNEALARAEAGSVRYNQLLTQQARIEQQAARAATPQPAASSAGALGTLGEAAGALGIGLGARELVNQGIAAGQAALSLRRTEAVVRELTGSQTRYNEVLALARENQRTYGGTLEENIQQLQGFAVAANRSGVAIQTLNDLSKRLAILSPEQGAAGASIAINEALSGNVSSLVRRFEIPKELLKGIEDSSKSAAEKLAILDDALTKSGVSAAAVKAALDPTTVAYNELGAAAETARLKVGGLTADGFRPTAEAATRVLDVLTGTKGSVGDLASGLGELGRTLNLVNPLLGGQQVVTGAVSRGYTALNQAVGGALTPLGQVGTVTQQLLNPLGTTADLLLRAAGYTGGYRVALNDLGNEVVKQARNFGLISGEVVNTEGAFNTYRAAQVNASTAAQDATNRIAAQQEALRQGGVEAAASAVNQQALNIELEQQKEVAQEAANSLYASSGGMTESGVAALEAAGKINVLEAGYLRLRIAIEGATKAAAGGLGVKPEDIGKGIPGLGDTGGPGKSNAPKPTVAPDEDPLGATARKRQQEIIAAQRDQQYALASTAQRVQILRAELAKLTPGTVDYIHKQTELRQAQQQLAQEQDRAAAKGEKAESAAERKRKAEEKALLSQERQTDLTLDTIENRYEDHYRKLKQQQEDYELSSSRSREDFEEQKQKLLAQGQIAEARELEKQFNKEQRRKQEDFQRQRSRENADVAADVARTQERAGIRGVKGVGGAAGDVRGDTLAPGLPSAPGGATGRAGGAAVGSPSGRAVALQINFAPIALNIDSQQAATALYQPISALIDLDAADAVRLTAVVSPPGGGQLNGLGGGRP